MKKRRHSLQLEQLVILRMKPEMVRGLERMAKRVGRSRSGLIRRVLARALESQEKYD